MEILRAETNDFVHLKNNNGNDPAATNTSSASSTIDDDEEEHDDEFSTVSTTDDKRTKSPLVNGVTDERNNGTSHLDYHRHRDRLAKELKEYEDRWLAHRNFLLYSQAFSMKNEDRERLFSQMNLSTNTDEHSSHHQQQQIFARLSKEERDRFIAAAALYNPTATSQPTFSFPTPYPWSNTTTSASLGLVPPPLPGVPPPPPPPPSSSSAVAAAAVGAPPTTTNDQSQQPKSPSSDDSGNQSNSGSTTEWTFEEQFRQLYELSDEPKRKEFLDDLFAFMQKRGTPVNRIPIMAKHVLDLYELFRLVVGKGGLVEVINKKLWREVTKGLNLPSSITSAAFTLRTQYMKYLYPYECEKLQLSSPGELQAAIEGNRREGRRPSYAFEYSSPPQIMPPPPPPPPSSSYLTSPLAHRSLDPTHGHDAMQHAAMAAAAALSHPFFLAAAAASRGPTIEDTTTTTTSSSSSSSTNPSTRLSTFNEHHLSMNKFLDRSPTTPTPKRCLSPPRNLHDESKKIRSSCFTPVSNASSSSANKMKIVAKENHGDLSSLTISMEFNGIIYQGVLYPNGNHD